MRFVFAFLACLVCVQLFGCDKNTGKIGNSKIFSADSMKLKVTIGSNIFHATLFNNSTAAAFRAMLPLRIDMSELNGNEKYFIFSYNLPANPSKPGNIQAGDIMLYGSETLVLFYKEFSTVYNYSPIGKINNASSLANALGSQNKTVVFELE